MSKKKFLRVTDVEQRIMIRALNDLRNSLLATGDYVDSVDEILLKVIRAPDSRWKAK